ncbi:MAG: hypothetical protein KAR20_05025 [Candidatus Heimdallarchaeota archaeon]|nr:hypothetical protein [Candidatus Heimdallarchaeota archaeon]
MKDFISEELVILKVSNGKEFSYKPWTGGDALIHSRKYLTPEGQTDFGKLQKCKILYNLKKVPYSSDNVQKIIGLNKPKAWLELSEDEKWSFLNKLSEKIIGDIITEINKIDFCDEELKKKS